MPEVKIVLTADGSNAVKGIGAVQNAVMSLNAANVGAATKSATAGLRAFNAVALNLGSYVSPQATAGLMSVTMAIDSIKNAATAAEMPLTKMLGLVAALGGVIAIGKYSKDLADSKLQEAQSESGLIESNEKLADSIMKVTEARLRNGQISEEDYKRIQREIFAAKALKDTMAQQDALRGIGSNLPGRKMDSSDFKDLRTLDIAAVQKSLLVTEQIILGKRQEAAIGLQLVTINDAIAQIEERRRFNSEALVHGTIDQAERDKLDVADLREIVSLEQQRQNLLAARVASNFSLTDAEKYKQFDALGMATGPNPESFTENLTAGLVDLQNTIGTFSQASAGLITSGLGMAMQGVGDSIMSVIEGTRNMGQIWASITRQMAAQAIQFGVQQLTSFLLTTTRKVIAHIAGEQAMTTATVTGAQTRGLSTKKEGLTAGFALASKAAGAVADIPYVGWALAIAAFASVMAMVIAASAVGFESGGFTGRGANNEVAGLVHRNEYVMPADAVDRIGVGNLEAMRSGLMPIEVGGTSSARATNVKQEIGIYLDADELLRRKRESIEMIALDAFRRNKVELGFQT